MCLAIPGKIEKTGETSAKVSFSGVLREVSLALVPDAKKGDYVLVHAGFAIQVLDEKEAAETLRLFEELYRLEDDSKDKN
ncbi:MAG: HypC/HybG/HupF family hydrogenase formation chaperone [bacterium]